MKKKLEADLISIAHRVLQMKNKSDVNQLCIESRKLYEKLTLLQFVEEHFEGIKPTIGQAEVVAKMKQFFEENYLTDVKPASTKLNIVVDSLVEGEAAAEEYIAENVENLVTEETKTADEEPNSEVKADFDDIETSAAERIFIDSTSTPEDLGVLASFELDIEADPITETTTKSNSIQISFDELLGVDYTQTHFVRVDHGQSNPLDFELPNIPKSPQEIETLTVEVQTSVSYVEPQNRIIIEKLASGISIGLNDRIAFVKHLFGNSDEDYNRVMNQLITFDSFVEAQNFIEDMVKPDYNNWEGKEEYEQRFIEIIEKKFA